MTTDIVLRTGDTLLDLSRSLRDSKGDPIDLTGKTVKAVISDPETGTIVDNPFANIVAPPTDGKITYNFDPSPAEGFYFLEFLVEGGGEQVHIPNAVPLSVLVTSTSSSEYSYSGNPGARPIDTVRFLLQDTNLAKARLTDAEILFLISQNTNAYVAGAEGAEIIGTQYTGYADKSVGPLSIRYGDLATRYFSLAFSLRNRGRRNSGAKAISTGTVRKPIFSIGMMDIGKSVIGDSNNPSQTSP